MYLRFSLLCASLVAAPFVSADESIDDTLRKLAGQWSIDAGSNQGVDLSPQKLEGNFAIITPKVITIFDRDKKESYKATYTLDTSKAPVHIDLVATRGGQQVKSLGIIRYDWLNADQKKELSIAYSLDATERPADFESPAGSKIMVFHMTAEPAVPLPK